MSEVKGTGKTDCAYPKERNILAGINIWSFSEKTEKLTVRVRAAATVDVRVRPVPWDQEDAPEQQAQPGHRGSPGATGPVGADGPVGATGPTGPTGPAGTITPAAAVANATSAEDVVNQFNLLLANMRAAGLLAE